MIHVALLGDSVFDNAAYVPGEPSVVEHLRRILRPAGRATLLARDGDVAADVAGQLDLLPPDATHLAVSAGGNDALAHSSLVLGETAASFAEVLTRLADVRDEFRDHYRTMLRAVLGSGRPALVCTIYDAIPGLSRIESAGLCLFNDVILREAVAHGLPVLDLRLICREAEDYSVVSPVEPSVAGGAKIADALARALRGHDFRARSTRIYT